MLDTECFLSMRSAIFCFHIFEFSIIDFSVGNSAPRAAVACPTKSKMNIAGIADMSKPPTGGILLRNTFKYGSVTGKRSRKHEGNTDDKKHIITLFQGEDN